MNKAVPWNVNGVGFDAREAAREAARRQGKSLGEWLHGVIADHAADIGVEAHEIAGQQRIDAVTSKLERLSARSAEYDRRMRAGRGTDFPRRRNRDDDMDERDEPLRHDRPSTVTELRRRREIPAIESTELLLEEAIDTMERRALRAERHTDKALQSFTDLLQRNETHRERERDSVTLLAQKLSEIETRLTDRVGQAVDNPIKGALARLEARLDTISRRGAAEATARQHAVEAAARHQIFDVAARQQIEMSPPAPAAVSPEPFHRLEEKLNSIYEALQARPPQPAAALSPVALAAAQAGHEDRHPQPTPKDRRLGEAIAHIAKRQQSLGDAEPEPASLPHAILRRQSAPVASNDEVRALETTPLVTIQNEITGLASKIEDLRRDVVRQRQGHAQPAVDVDSLRAEIATMSETLRELAPRSGPSGEDQREGELRKSMGDPVPRNQRPTLAAVSSLRRTVTDLDARGAGLGRDSGDVNDMGPESSAITRIDEQMREIRDLIATTVSKIDQAAEAPRPVAVQTRMPSGASSENTGLEKLVRDLSRKMEAVQAPDSGHQALDALRQQISVLSARFERSDGGLAKLTSIEKSMSDLFAHLDETRATVETSAARAAREVLRIAMEEGRVQSDQGTATSLATIQALQDEAEARTSSTLNAVHGTLEKVVNRLAIMEGEIAEARKRPAVRPTETRAPEMRAPELRAPEMRAPEIRLPQSGVSLGAPDPMLHQALGVRPTDKAVKEPTPPRQPDLDGENGRADFIAAARRAAKVAQNDPALSEMKRSAGKASSPGRAGLIEQSRDYITRHKRPVLLSIAALFVIIGTMAIIQRIGLDESDVQTADTAPPTQIASAAVPAPAPQPRTVRRSDELTPSALPASAPPLANPIPGSDPIQTGSIPSLPSFAAAGAPRPAPRPVLSANLKAMAEAGDSAAEYVLGAQYAEGSAMPRDFTLAAQWYQKAAAQNLAPAQYRLASLYEKGLGVTQDKDKAKTLYLQAAEAGNPRAMHNLAVLLADGDGHPDYDGAATWFRKAAQYGIHDSQYNLAILLARGIGVQQSMVQSYQWFAIAAAQGDSDAGKKRDEVGTKLAANDLAVAKALAASFRPRIADIAATEVQPPPGGWDGASAPSPLNSARPKISSL